MGESFDRPSAEQPRVYHLGGLDAHPQTGKQLPGSLALSEDDHLEMLVNLAEGRGKESADRLPALVRGALFDHVILLGFRLDSWAFRALYYGLIRQTGQEGEQSRARAGHERSVWAGSTTDGSARSRARVTVRYPAFTSSPARPGCVQT